MRASFLKYVLLYFCLLVAAWWTWQMLRPKPTAEPALEAWVLDVGQGESVFVKEPSGKRILFDGGPDDTVLSELGHLLPPWDRRIDLVVLSHNHSDHIRGLISVIERYDVKEVWVSGAVYTTGDYQAWTEALAKHNLQPKSVHAPFQENFGSLVLQVHHPLADLTGQRVEHEHDADVAVEVSYGTQDILLSGDLEEKNETDMLAACQPPTCSLEAEILQVPHHGSAYGLLPDFLSAVSPKIAVIPVGKNNRYNHPRENILALLADRHIPTYRTDLQGQIHITISPSRLSVQTAHAAPQ